jgi:serine/threonine protein kinase
LYKQHLSNSNHAITCSKFGESHMPDHFDHYTIVQQLAKKYSHSTYLAAPIDEPERQVVLIVFSSWLLSSLHERQALLKRAQSLTKLQNPHLLPIFDAGIVENQPFVVREYVPHQSLRSYLKQLAPERLKLSDALSLLLQVGEALVYAHSHQIVHGNLKPENILLDVHGRTLLTDFALFNRSDVIARDQATEEYAFCYLAPEQLAGSCDASADQYALGCLFYELITGGVPLATKGLTSLIMDQSYYVQPAPLSKKVPHLSTSLEAAVLKALAKDPSDRFGDLSLFLEVIRTAVSPLPAFPLSRPKTPDQQKPHSRLAQPPKAPDSWVSVHVEATSDYPLSHRLRASSGAAVDDIIEKADVKDPFAEVQQEDDLGYFMPVSEENDSGIAFAHDAMTEVIPINIDDTSGQTVGQRGSFLQTMQSPPHFPQRKQSRVKGHFIRLLLLTGAALLLLICSSPSLGVVSVVRHWEQTQTSPIPTLQGGQSSALSQTLQTSSTHQLIPTVVFKLPSHSTTSIPSQPEPVVTPSATPTANLLPTATPTGPSPSGYWKFDEGSGSTAYDSSGNNYTGTLQGNASWAKGKMGPYALSLDGSSGTDVDIPATVVDTTQSYTFAAWVLLTNNSSGHFYTAVSIDGNQMSGEYLQFDGGNFCFCIRASDSTSATVSSAATSYTPNTNQWYHLAGVYDATAKTTALYVNGLLVQSTAFSSAWKASGHTLIGRGRYQGNPVDFWPGLIDDVHIYQTALSASDIQALAQ